MKKEKIYMKPPPQKRTIKSLLKLIKLGVIKHETPRRKNKKNQSSFDIQ